MSHVLLTQFGEAYVLSTGVLWSEVLLVLIFIRAKALIFFLQDAFAPFLFGFVGDENTCTQRAVPPAHFHSVRFAISSQDTCATIRSPTASSPTPAPWTSSATSIRHTVA